MRRGTGQLRRRLSSDRTADQSTNRPGGTESHLDALVPGIRQGLDSVASDNGFYFTIFGSGRVRCCLAHAYLQEEEEEAEDGKDE